MKQWTPLAYPGPGDTHRNANPTGGVPRGSWPDGVGYQQIIDELCGVVTGNGLALAESDSQQLLKAMRLQRTNAILPDRVTGTANAIALSLTGNGAPPITAYNQLLHAPIRFVASAANTGAVTVAVDGLAPQPLTWALDGSALAGGDFSLGAEIEIAYDGTAFRLLSSLSPTRIAALRLSQPYLGFEGSAVSQSIPTGAVTRISSYTGIVNNLPGASHAAGVITIGMTGKYIVSANHNALLPDVGSYGYSTAISKVDAGGVAIASIAAQPSEYLSASSVPGSRAGSVTALTRLAAGDKIAAFLTHNRGSNISVSISLDIEFRGV